MAIGKPLLISERKGVSQPVLSAQTQALNTNVPVQKLAMVDYSIGMNNAKASFAVSNELVGMVEAGVKAAVIVDKTNKDYKRLELMEDWQTSNVDYQGDFARAVTPEEQASVIKAQKLDTEKRITGWGESQGNTLEAAKGLANMKHSANKQYSAFTTTYQNNLHTRTTALHNNTIQNVKKDLMTNPTADVITGLNQIDQTTQDLVEMGAIQGEIALANVLALREEIIVGRAGLFAKQYAQDISATEALPPTDEQIDAKLHEVMGVSLGDKNNKLLRNTFNEAYDKQISSYNRHENAKETRINSMVKKPLDKFYAELDHSFADGTFSEADEVEAIEHATQLDAVKFGVLASVKKKISDFRYGAASAAHVEFNTVGAGSKAFESSIDPDDTNYYDVTLVRKLLAPQGVSEATIRATAKFWNDKNIKSRADLGKNNEAVVQGILGNIGDDRNSPISKMMREDPDVFNAFIKDGGARSWERVLGKNKFLSEAYYSVLADADKAQLDEYGPFSSRGMDQAGNLRALEMREFLEKSVNKHFTAAVASDTAIKNDKVLASKEKALALEESNRTKANAQTLEGNFRALYDAPTVGLAPKEEIWQSLKSWVGQELERLGPKPGRWEGSTPNAVGYEEDGLDSPATYLYKNRAAMKSNILGSINASIGTGYVTGLANQGLTDKLEELIGSKLTPEMLAGDNPEVNALASEIIKDESASVLGKMYESVAEIFTGDDWEADQEAKYNEMARGLKQQVLEGINKGIESVAPKPQNTAPTPEVPQAEPLVDISPQAQAVPDPTEPSIMQGIAQALAPVADTLFGGSTAEADPVPFDNLPPEIQQIANEAQYQTPDNAAKSILRNNPFNVRDSKNKWDGLVASDGSGFMSTDTPLHGLRAGWINMLAKLSRGQTVAEMVATLSPQSDNNPTAAMVKVVSAMADLNPNDTVEVSMDNFEEIKQLGLGLLRFEAPGHKYPDSLIDEAINLAIEQKSGGSTPKAPITYPAKKGNWSEIWKQAVDKLPTLSSITGKQISTLQTKPLEEINLGAKSLPKDQGAAIQEVTQQSIMNVNEGIYDFAADAIRPLKDISRDALNVVPMHLRFVLDYLKDNKVLGGGEQELVTEKYMTPEVMDVLKTAIRNARKRNPKTRTVNYADFPTPKSGIPVHALFEAAGKVTKGQVVAGKKRWGSSFMGVMRMIGDSFDPVIAASGTFGAFSFEEVNGEYVMHDIYDFSKFKGEATTGYSTIRKWISSEQGDKTYKTRANLGSL